MPKQAPYKKTTCFIISDIHLNNIQHDHISEDETLRKRNFHHFLQKLLKRLEPDEKVMLILNGDIIDVNGSWYGSPSPWVEDKAAVEAHFLTILQQILNNNVEILNALNALLRHPQVEIIYIIGNHDELLGKFPAGQQLLQETLCAEDTCPRIRFESTFQSEELSLHVEHGHVYDPFNHSLVPEIPPLGEVINVSIVNELQKKVSEALQQQDYTATQVEYLRQRLAEIQFLRPLSLFPLWINHTLEKYQHRFHQSVFDRHKLERTIYACIWQIITDRQLLAFFIQKLHLPGWLISGLVKSVLRFPFMMPVLSYVVSKISHHSQANTMMSDQALTIHRRTGLRMIVFGHTHRPTARPLDNNGYYFNTGSWTPMINLVRKKGDFILTEKFRRLEHCGVLRIERDWSDPKHSEPEFYLETTRSGLIK